MLRNVILACLVLIGGVTGTARADDRAVVEAFYKDLLSAPAAADLPQRAAKILHKDWATTPPNRFGTGPENFAKSLAGFGQAVPDLKWEIVEVIVAGNRYVVRGRATGTPAKPFLGVEPTGKKFDVMSIDIHTVENGKIVRSYHVEEWLHAIQQLTAK